MIRIVNEMIIFILLFYLNLYSTAPYTVCTGNKEAVRVWLCVTSLFNHHKVFRNKGEKKGCAIVIVESNLGNSNCVSIRML